MALKQAQRQGLQGQQQPAAAWHVLDCLPACLAASYACLVHLLSAIPVSRGRPMPGAAAAASSGGAAGSRGTVAVRHVMATAALVLMACLVVTTALQVGHPAAFAALASATATCCTLHALLSCLPGSFTAGEAMVAAQAAVLLGAAALSAPGSGSSSSSSSGMPPERFVTLLTASSLLAASLLIPLLLQLQSRARLAATPAGRRHKPAASSLDGSKLPYLTAVAAGATIAAAAPAVAWAVQFALASRRRAQLCGWWALCLGASLRVMAWLSDCGWVPAILGEWVRLRRPGAAQRCS